MKNTINKNMMKMIINGTAYVLERQLKVLEDANSDKDMYPLKWNDLIPAWFDEDLGDYLEAKGVAHSLSVEDTWTLQQTTDWLIENTEGVFETLEYADGLYRSFGEKSLMYIHNDFTGIGQNVCQWLIYYTAMYIIRMATKMVTKSDDIESKEEARELISIIEDTSPSINIVVH